MFGGSVATDNLVKNSTVVLAYAAVVVILLLLVAFYVMKIRADTKKTTDTTKKTAERLNNTICPSTIGNGNGTYNLGSLSTGNAGARWVEQTSGNQDQGAASLNLNNVTCPGNSNGGSERLLSEREPPVIYNVYDEINAINDSLKTSYDDVLANFAIQNNDLTGAPVATTAGAPERFYGY